MKAAYVQPAGLLRDGLLEKVVVNCWYDTADAALGWTAGPQA